MWPFIFIALMAGVLMPFQAAINAELGRHLQNPLMASFISFLLGTIGLFIVNFFTHASFSSPFKTSVPIPAYLFVGGILGAFFSTAAVFLIPKLGALTMFALFLLGQFMASSLMDHFGLFGILPRPFTLVRAIGLALLFLGTYVIRIK